MNNYTGSSPAKDELLLVGNLVNATEHVLDMAIAQPLKGAKYLEIAKTIDETRSDIQRKIFKKYDYPEESWCLYKHLAAARVLAQELFKTGYEEDLIISVNEILIQMWGSDYEPCATCREDKGEEK